MLINHVNNHHTEPRAMRQAPQNSAQKQLFEVWYGALLRGNLYKSYCFKKNFIQKNIPDNSAGSLEKGGRLFQGEPRTSPAAGFAGGYLNCQHALNRFRKKNRRKAVFFQDEFPEPVWRYLQSLKTKRAVFGGPPCTEFCMYRYKTKHRKALFW